MEKPDWFRLQAALDDKVARLEQENAELCQQRDEMLMVLKQVSTLLDALRMSSGVGNILTEHQKEIYDDVFEMVKRAIVSGERASDEVSNMEK